MPDHSEIDASLGIYNPASLPPEVLLEEFIARRPLLDRALGIVRDNHRGQPQQHLLLLGPRGTGKTTFLLALAYSIQRDPDLSREWLPVIFPEETYGIGDLADFWLEATEQLLHATGNEAARTEVESLREANPGDIEERSHALFLRHVDAAGKRILLGIENLNDFFSAVSDQTQQHRLRAFLMEDDRVMLAASSTSYFDASGKIDLPFYEFFRILRLERLTVDESIEVLTRLAELRGDSNVLTVLKNQPERIHSLHVLTGGNPRLIKMVYRLLNEGIDGDARRDLNRLLEDCTPYFKSRIEEISTEERRVFDHVARHWDPVAVGDIQTALRRPSNKISIYLRRLVESGFLEEAPASTQKRKAYQVAERFYNIYYLMRFTRSSRRRLEWLVQAMRVIYSPDDFKSWTEKTLAAWSEEGGKSSTGEREAFLHALTVASDTPKLRRELIGKALQTAWTHDQLDCLDRLLDRKLAKQTLGEEFDLIDFFAHLPVEERKLLGYEPDTAEWWFLLTDPLEAAGSYLQAEQAYHKAIEIDPQFALTWICLANLLQNHLLRYVEAEQAYRRAIEIDPNNPLSWTGLGLLLHGCFQRYEEADQAYRKAIEIDSNDALLWDFFGALQQHFQRYNEAEQAFRKAIEIEPNSAYLWEDLGLLLRDHLQRHDEAEQAFRKAIEIDPNSADLWEDLGSLLRDHLQRHGEAEQAFRKAIEIDPNLANLWEELGSLLCDSFQRYEEAEQAFRNAIAIDPNAVASWNSLGILLTTGFQRYHEAEQAFHKAIEIDPNAAFLWNNLGNLYRKHLDSYAEAEEAYRKAIQINPAYAYSHAGISDLFDQLSRPEESRQHALQAGLLGPSESWPRKQFLKLCGEDSGAWLQMLPKLVSVLNAPIIDPEVTEMTLRGLEFVLSRQAIAPREAVAMIEAAGNPEPLTDIVLALRSIDEPGLLDKVSPERRTVARDFLRRVLPNDEK